MFSLIILINVQEIYFCNKLFHVLFLKKVDIHDKNLSVAIFVKKSYHSTMFLDQSIPTLFDYNDNLDSFLISE